jgi:hypothetical protein
LIEFQGDWASSSDSVVKQQTNPCSTAGRVTELMRERKFQEGFPRTIAEAMESEEVGSTYFNGFTLTVGAGDVALILTLNGKPTRVLNCSFTVSKTLAEILSEAIQGLENASGNTIMTTDNINEALKKGADDLESE